MLQWLYTYVASFFSYCFICFPDACCKCVYLDVAYVSHIYCKCFIWMLCMFCNGFKCLSGVLANVLDACFKCLIYLPTHIANVVSECFKSGSGVVSLSSPSTSSPWCLLLLPTLVGHPPPPPLFSILVTFRVARAPRRCVKRHWKRIARPYASKPVYF